MVMGRRRRPDELRDKIDMMIAELSKQSRLLKERCDVCYRQAEALAKEGIEEASKKWLAMTLVFRKMRSNIESQIADLFLVRTQLEITPPEEMGSVMTRAGEILVNSERVRETVGRAMSQLDVIIRAGVEGAATAGYYGVSSEELNKEFERMQEKIGLEAAERMELPEVPKEVTKEEEKAEREKAGDRG